MYKPVRFSSLRYELISIPICLSSSLALNFKRSLKFENEKFTTCSHMKENTVLMVTSPLLPYYCGFGALPGPSH